MPLYEFKCVDCGEHSEILIIGTQDEPACKSCGSTNMTKQISAHSSMSGPAKNSMPGPGDTACCGSSPGQAAGCAGPGSCCGKSF
ncbi:MAG: zinc ribbon domain-containing protein [Desulfobacula sp.]|uniref:FmdB family zinc ribbon protein n=1 Tax=Desulfobacula sp. TaxID=2593537 RepID=UPI0025C3F55D|nr:zinc ribbon domain-containing protein [Desulfobacula sp.]MCD4718840.1 zinc ribbon domain-containing protein [Desulfobacula sp.]